MKRIADPIETDQLCCYGCGCIAKFRNRSGKLMCQKSSNSCPSVRSKNSKGLKNSGRDYVASYANLSQESKDRMNWSKGLTKETNESVATMATKLKGRPGVSRPHSEETKQKLSKQRTEWLKIPENRKNYGRGKKSWMELCFEKWLTEHAINGWRTEVHFWNKELERNYFVDFLFEERKLIVELDGTQHRKTKEQDAARDLYMESLGYHVVRIPHEEFKKRYFSSGFEDILGR